MIRPYMAKAYRKGWAIIPLKYDSKVPHLPKGHQFLSTRPSKEDYATFEFHNYGIVTGALSGIVVLDIDEEGFSTLEELGKYPYDDFTPQVVTPNGLHIYYKHNPAIRTSVGKIGAGLDVRSNGAYVVGPGSVVHDNVYEWKEGYGIDLELADAPSWLYGPTHNDVEQEESGNHYTIPGIVREGGRNSVCHRLASYFVGKDMPHVMVLDMVLHFNNNWVKPPLSDDEIVRLCESAESYRKEKQHA